MKLDPRRQLMSLLSGTLVLLLGILAFLIYQSRAVEKAEAGTLAPDIAVARALTVAGEFDLPYGGLRGRPTEIYGRIMTYAEANDLLTGRPIAPNSLEIELADKQVWLILFQGNIVEHVPPVSDGSIPEKQVQHSQMTVVLDAFTGEMLRRTLLAPLIKFDVRTLSELPYPAESSFVVFPTHPIQTAEPLPSATAPAN
ncbi:MAG: hypothetical protein IT331_11455 [Anaerolineae bacterium]|nr:hypothetical protein [Anaerolineae bacterium]